MCLRADAIVFVFDPRVLEITQRVFGRLGGTRQHESDGMKQAHFGVGKAAFCCKSKRFADVAEKHVGALDVFKNLASVKSVSSFQSLATESGTECLCDCLLDQPFL